MWWKLICGYVLLCEVRGQLNLLGIKLPLDLGLTGHKKEETTIRPVTTPPTLATTTTPPRRKGCQHSVTLYPSGEPACQKRLIFEDNFDNPIVNKNKWSIEQYTPIINGPDYEFVSYQNSDQTLFVKDGKLYLKPVAFTKDEDVKGVLDLRDGCTSRMPSECYYEQQTVFILPAVKSAKVSSKFSFTYGRVEVRAKLPRGDWIFPKFELVPRTASTEGAKIWIGYVRGNDYYIGADVGDTGSKVLFGGPVLAVEEPERSSKVHNRPSAEAYNKDMHIYTLTWEPGKISVAVDNDTYGTTVIDTSDRRFSTFSSELYLSFGVGVGGINDFSDDFISSRPKPWKNMDRKQIKDFFDARETWLKTWNGDDTALQIDYVKIWAL